MTAGLSEMPDVELEAGVGDAPGYESKRVAGGVMVIVVIILFATISTFCSSLFRRGSKLHGAVSKIAGSKHIEIPTLPVGLMTVVVSTVVGFELEVTVMETTPVVVD